MTTVFPGGIDALPRPGPTTFMDAAGFEGDLVIDNISDAIEAIETKLGTGTDVAAANEVLRGTGTGATAFGKLVPGDFTDGTTALVKIGEAVGSGASAALVVGSIPATYRALYLEVTGRSSVSALNTTLSLYINADGAGNYDYQRSDVQAATHTASEGLAQTTMSLGYVAGATAPANVAGSARLFVPDYAQTVFQKMVHWQAHVKYGTATGNLINTQGSGQWRNTAAINNVDLRLGAGTWITGSRLTVWGLPA